MLVLQKLGIVLPACLLTSIAEAKTSIHEWQCPNCRGTGRTR